MRLRRDQLVGFKEGALVNERPDLPDDLLRRTLGQATTSCACMRKSRTPLSVWPYPLPTISSMMLRWLLNSKSSLFSPLATALLIASSSARTLSCLASDTISLQNGVVGLQEGVLLNERPDLRDDVLGLALGQAPCGLRDSLLDRRAGEPRDDRRFLHRCCWLELLAYSLVVGLSVVAEFGWESILASLGRVPLARLRALSGRRGGAGSATQACPGTQATWIALALRRPVALAFSFLWLSTDPSFRRASLHGGHFLSTGTRLQTSGINRFSKDGWLLSGSTSMRSGHSAPSLSIGERKSQ